MVAGCLLARLPWKGGHEEAVGYQTSYSSFEAVGLRQLGNWARNQSARSMLTPSQRRSRPSGCQALSVQMAMSLLEPPGRHPRPWALAGSVCETGLWARPRILLSHRQATTCMPDRRHSRVDSLDLQRVSRGCIVVFRWAPRSRVILPALHGVSPIQKSLAPRRDPCIRLNPSITDAELARKMYLDFKKP